ncbi:AAA family ATPase [Streptomyces sp. NPDC048550]|uniref:AAA family ATPase n=1 Tax=unclassified Streptomyces TaxID=2593676 RepID=UPI00225426DA|nr:MULTISPECIES: AAA family ATPase [unclassified Streptomyces]MCX5145262.1 ATP-binding protein [Streptomyces sp. NBC_00320]WSN53633.1 ATP-binding protein [Streptomyces sp. NBC_01296]WSW64140.1 ATP-binding protein [Streptomyces sp. NBC_00998]
MTVRRFGVLAASGTGAVDGVPAARRARSLGGPVRDLRGRGPHGPQWLGFAEGDIVVVSGLPGGGKSTLIKRAAEGGGIDSQDVRERWERRMPRALPYAVYRPLVRCAHYWGLWRTLRSGASAVVHDCGTQSWVRSLLAAAARRRGRGLHLLLLDTTPEEALSGQAARGRGVSAYAFARHRGAVTRLLREAESGRLPAGCTSAVLLDRSSAARVTRIAFRRDSA